VFERVRTGEIARRPEGGRREPTFDAPQAAPVLDMANWRQFPTGQPYRPGEIRRLAEEGLKNDLGSARQRARNAGDLMAQSNETRDAAQEHRQAAARSTRRRSEICD
jgi:hypothetical protein